MTSKGQLETEKLKRNLEEQLERLVCQLSDLDECKDDLDREEYAASRADTLEQLQEFHARLSKLVSGDITLVDQLGVMQLATEAAIKNAGRGPTRQDPQQLRERLASDQTVSDKVQILSTLRQLGERLSPAQLQFLEQHGATAQSNTSDRSFVRISEETGVGEKVFHLAGSDLRSLQQGT